MKSSHVRFTDREYSWIKNVADAERRSISGLIEWIVTKGLQDSFANYEPARAINSPVQVADNLFGEE